MRIVYETDITPIQKEAVEKLIKEEKENPTNSKRGIIIGF